jgi:hypothetical protein
MASKSSVSALNFNTYLARRMPRSSLIISDSPSYRQRAWGVLPLKLSVLAAWHTSGLAIIMAEVRC